MFLASTNSNSIPKNVHVVDLIFHCKKYSNYLYPVEGSRRARTRLSLHNEEQTQNILLDFASLIFAFSANWKYLFSVLAPTPTRSTLYFVCISQMAEVPFWFQEAP